MFYFRKTDVNSIDDSILYILDEGNKYEFEGCLSVQFDRKGNIGQTRCYDSILGYSKIRDANVILRFFDDFAQARTKTINEKKDAALEEKKKELEPIVYKLLEEFKKKSEI